MSAFAIDSEAVTVEELRRAVSDLRQRLKDADKAIAIKADTNRKIFALNEQLLHERYELLDTIEWWKNRYAYRAQGEA